MIRRVVGKSMEPTLYEGDLVLTKRSMPKKNDVVVAEANGREVIKRVKKVHASSIEVVGDNAEASTDSRDFGPLPLNSVGGVVWMKLTKHQTKGLMSSALGVFFVLCAVVSTATVLAMLPEKTPVYTTVPPSDTRPSLFSAGMVKKDVTYCNDQALDIYFPRTDDRVPAPVVMFIHGGGWFRDKKDNEPAQLVLLDSLRDKGFAVISIDYRLAPDHLYPAAVDDARCAVRFVRAKASTYGFDGKNVMAFGFSAGGHLAAMLGTVDETDGFTNQPYEQYSSKVNAVVSLAGLFDFTQGLRTNNRININRFLGDEPAERAQPVAYVDSKDAPFLLIHGTKDALVLSEQNTVFAERLRQSDVSVIQIDVVNAVHGLESSDGEPTSPTREQVAQRISDFLLNVVSKTP